MLLSIDFIPNLFQSGMKVIETEDV